MAIVRAARGGSLAAGGADPMIGAPTTPVADKRGARRSP
jgi:hypothetical protein